MGYTALTKQLVKELIGTYNVKSVVDLGAQNDFSGPNLPAPYISEWYRENGIGRYMAIDLNGENFSYKLDLSKPLPEDFLNYKDKLSNGDPFLFSRIVDMVGDIGTSEHVGDDGKFGWEAIYNCWLNKHNLLKIGGIMVNENPKTGNWPAHGFNYYTRDFYMELCKIAGYNLIAIGEQAAMGNVTDGWNIFSVMEKTSEKFVSLEEFKRLPLKQS